MKLHLPLEVDLAPGVIWEGEEGGLGCGRVFVGGGALRGDGWRHPGHPGRDAQYTGPRPRRLLLIRVQHSRTWDHVAENVTTIKLHENLKTTHQVLI